MCSSLSSISYHRDDATFMYYFLRCSISAGYTDNTSQGGLNSYSDNNRNAKHCKRFAYRMSVGEISRTQPVGLGAHFFPNINITPVRRPVDRPVPRNTGFQSNGMFCLFNVVVLRTIVYSFCCQDLGNVGDYTRFFWHSSR